MKAGFTSIRPKSAKPIKPIDEQMLDHLMSREKGISPRAIRLCAACFAVAAMLAAGLYTRNRLQETEKARVEAARHESAAVALQEQLQALPDESGADELSRKLVPEASAASAILYMDSLMAGCGLQKLELYTDKVTAVKEGELMKWRAAALGEGPLEAALSFLSKAEGSGPFHYGIEAASISLDDGNAAVRLEFSFYVYRNS
jgi:hypothetical protein